MNTLQDGHQIYKRDFLHFLVTRAG